MKGKSLWDMLLDEKIDLPSAHKLSEATSADEPVSTSGRAPLTSDQEEAIKKCNAFTADQLMALNKWAKETNNLKPYQRQIIYSVGMAKNRGRDPSASKPFSKFMEEAISLGFNYEAAE